MKNLLLKQYFLFYFVLQLCQLFAITISAKAEDGPSETTKKIVHIGAATFEVNYGPEGREEPVKLTLYIGMQPGSFVSFITKSDNKGTVDICDHSDVIMFQMDIRFQDDILHLDSRVDQDSEANYTNPVGKCAKTTTVILYQADGYKIFVNGQTVAFFKHRSDKPVSYINIAYDKIYKIYYLTTDTVNK